VGETNWARTYTYGARAIHRPTSVEQVQEIVARASRVRALGSRHSFTDIADSDELLSTDRLPSSIEIDRDRGTVSVGAGSTYATLARALDRDGLALHNLASLPHIEVAGAISTATHGSGDRLGNLATAVASIDLVTCEGELRTMRRGERYFDGAVVGLGSLGVVTRVQLDAEPSYEVCQHVFEDVSWSGFEERFDEIFAAGVSVSAFTRWGERVDQVWVKTKSGEPTDLRDVVESTVACGQVHPIDGFDPASCTEQLGVAGPWWDRLPHFRTGFTPSSGDELQSEYLVPREHALDAIATVRAHADAIRPVLQVSEIRSVAADTLWMSPQYGRDTIGIHFTWRKDEPAVRDVLAVLEPALAPMRARPHWGKLFLAGAEGIAGLYERRDDFVRLMERLDPQQKFRNAWLERHVLGSA
jgi:xylitol oxidase